MHFAYLIRGGSGCFRNIFSLSQRTGPHGLRFSRDHDKVCSLSRINGVDAIFNLGYALTSFRDIIRYCMPNGCDGGAKGAKR